MLKKFGIILSIVFIITQFIVFFSCNPFNRDKASEISVDELVEDLNDSLYPLGTSLNPLEWSDQTLGFLNNIRSARIVALGETTHGTREFFQMKHRIFKYLVENFNYRAFCFEADFAESIYLNQYVLTGEGDLEELMETRMHYWTWKTQEVRDLLEWMKDYNQGKLSQDKIHFVGFDCQFTDLQPDLIKEYLNPIMPALWDQISSLIDEVNDLAKNSYSTLTYENAVILNDKFENFIQIFENNKTQLVNQSSQNQFQLTRQLIQNFNQAWKNVANHDGIGFGSNFANRDRNMAENAEWTADFFGNNSKIALWAHNRHVANDKFYGSTPAMGYHLKESLQDGFQIIGFSFFSGKFRAKGKGERDGKFVHDFIPPTENDSINYVFSQAKTGNFAFDLTSLGSSSNWADWTSPQQPFLWIGATYDGHSGNYFHKIDPLVHFDWLIHINTTTESKLLTD